MYNLKDYLTQGICIPEQPGFSGKEKAFHFNDLRYRPV